MEVFKMLVFFAHFPPDLQREIIMDIYHLRGDERVAQCCTWSSTRLVSSLTLAAQKFDSFYIEFGKLVHGSNLFHPIAKHLRCALENRSLIGPNRAAAKGWTTGDWEEVG